MNRLELAFPSSWLLWIDPQVGPNLAALVGPKQLAEDTLEVLVSAVPRDAVDAAVAACGVGERRSGGKLPAHVTAYLTMAMCLFAEDDYEEVATKVTGSLSRWGCWEASWSVPTASGITQARKRLGPKVLAEVFEQIAAPVAEMLTRGAWLRAASRRAGCGLTFKLLRQLPDLELRHRRHARIEDRNAEDTGMRNSPCHDLAQNRAWRASADHADDEVREPRVTATAPRGR